MMGTMPILLDANTIVDQLKNVTPTPAASSEGLSDMVGRSPGGAGFWQMMSLVFMLIIILLAAYFTSKFVASFKLGQLKKSNFQVIDAYRISANKVLQLVKIGNKYIVLGIGKDSINVITELEEKEVIFREVNQGEKQTFRQIMDKLKKNNE